MFSFCKIIYFLRVYDMSQYTLTGAKISGMRQKKKYFNANLSLIKFF